MSMERNRWFDIGFGLGLILVGFVLAPFLLSLYTGSSMLLGVFAVMIPIIAGLVLFIVGLKGGGGPK